MKLIVNGESKEFFSPPTVADLLAEMGLVGKRVAVEINQEIVPKSQYAAFALKDNDRMEVVFAIGGG
jgi:thiamine biosynthesis protein ThiS